MKSKIGGVGILVFILAVYGVAGEGSWAKIAKCPKVKKVWTTVWTGSEWILVGEKGARYNPETDTWKSITKCPLSSGVLGRYEAVWTGSEVIIWGEKRGVMSGQSHGVRYNPNTDTWKEMAKAPLETRSGHSMVWTGKELIVWGGVTAELFYKSDGARYDPETDTWTLIAAAPSVMGIGRGWHEAVWTGKEMVVFGGIRGKPAGTMGLVELFYTLSDGARYNPETDTWKPMAKAPLKSMLPLVPINPLHLKGGILCAVWTGREMIVVESGRVEKGKRKVEMVWDGARYNLDTDSWKPMALPPLKPRNNLVSLWSGTEMIIWGGNITVSTGATSSFATCYFDGARYNPEMDSWTPLPPLRKPKSPLMAPATLKLLKKSYLRTHHALWTGKELITYDGRYNP